MLTETFKDIPVYMFGSHRCIGPLMREGSYFSSMHEHYVGSESFHFVFFFPFFFFAEMLGLSFWFELVLYGDICHHRGEDAHRKLREAHWRLPYGTTSSHLVFGAVFGAEVLAVRASES